MTDIVSFDVTIDGVDSGTMEIGLFGKTAPKTVANFVKLAQKGEFEYNYEGVPFHRIIDDFMIQGMLVCSCIGSTFDMHFRVYKYPDSLSMKHNHTVLLLSYRAQSLSTSYTRSS